jgi:prolipoprotein diacylglyceryltransferase
MTFPVQLHIFGRAVPIHGVMELIAYSAGFQLYLLLRRRSRRASVPFETNMWIVVGCVFGALVGAKLLAWLESPAEYWASRYSLAALGGKTIVGGLLGGWIGVEVAKNRLHVRQSTGDLFVFPLILGMCIGRIGCFLSGLPDHTYGTHTTLPWAVNFGDGPRHPTQLYEIVFLAGLGLVIALIERGSAITRNGERFRWFMLGYLVFRFVIEFIKPRFAPYAGLSAIQLASFLGVMVCIAQLYRLRRQVPEPIGEAVI